MGLQFVLTDRGLEEHYPRRFERRGRFVLAGSLRGLGGGRARAPSSTILVVLLTAFVPGRIRADC